MHQILGYLQNVEAFDHPQIIAVIKLKLPRFIDCKKDLLIISSRFLRGQYHPFPYLTCIMMTQEAVIAIVALVITCIPLSVALWRYMSSRSAKTRSLPRFQHWNLRLAASRPMAMPALPLEEWRTGSTRISLQQQVSITTIIHNTFCASEGIDIV